MSALGQYETSLTSANESPFFLPFQEPPRRGFEQGKASHRTPETFHWTSPAKRALVQTDRQTDPSSFCTRASPASVPGFWWCKSPILGTEQEVSRGYVPQSFCRSA